MTSVKIRAVTAAVTAAGPLGMQYSFPRIDRQLINSSTGLALPDDVYSLRQDGRVETCHVRNGFATNVDWVDPDKPLSVE